MTTTIIRRSGLAALALTMSLGIAACGSDEESSSSGSSSSDSSATEETPEAEEATGAASGTFGPACDAIPEDGDGSLEGMSTAPVATAASANPVLETLVAAVTAADLGNTLNEAEDITVFAPANDAFAAIPEADLNALLADKEALTGVLTYHVVPGRIAPEDLAGEFDTLAGPKLTVEGSGEEFTVGANNANVICGNIQTDNATVYVIDGVLSPPAS